MQKLFQFIDQKIDATGMYRTVSAMLVFLVGCSLIMGLSGLLAYTFLEQLVSLTVALTVALGTNYLASKLTRVPVNMESAVITALIVFFLILPAQLSSLSDSWLVAVVTFLAVVSKFVVVWKKQHLLNPAAAGAVALTLSYSVLPMSGHFESSWWIGNMQMFLPLFLAGLVVVIKIQKWAPVVAFLLVGFTVFLVEEWRFGGDLLSGASRYWFSGPSLFLGFFMLTEPFTMPPTRKLQWWYGAFVGALSQVAVFAPYFRMTPELALVIGNLSFYPSTLRQKLVLPFVSAREVARNTWEFSFAKPEGVRFVPGQYLEWMLPHKDSDNRGVRRYFTIASAPSESMLKIGVRFGETISSYKTALKALKSGDVVIASQLSGDFVLPKDPSRKIALVAGGIGITPFVSQLTELKLKGQRRDVVLFSCNNTLAESAYQMELSEVAKDVPLRVIEVLAKENLPGHETGFLTAEMIIRLVVDYRERDWYISGPPGMVGAYSSLLVKLEVPASQIHTDFFPGLA